MRADDTLRRRRLAVTGQVQGVGFRPFVYRLAAELSITGWVVNDGRGVTIEVQGPAGALDEFQRRLPAELPPLAEVSHCDAAAAEPLAGEEHFEIRPSEGGELTDAQVTVDTAVCEDCLREMSDPADPRHDYPFINCTNCGPRYTLVARIPYDRPNTTMADFAMCPYCRREYDDPANRRFHAQPIACPQCGPAVWLVDEHGRQIECDDAVAHAAAMLLAGRIVAVKGLGGFHLACRADDEHAVNRLRLRKRRDAKPFAIMVADLAAARELADVSDDAAAMLAGPLRPIVLLPRRSGAKVAAGVAGALTTVGVMLAYTPLHHLLFARLAALRQAQGGGAALVMTSGNYSDEPLVKDNDAAVAHLGAIADAILLHNRRIERRIDDSVVQVAPDGRLGVLRRARGFAPRPVRLDLALGADAESPAVLAVGAELKNAVCLYRAGRAVLSEHIGDLRDGRTYRHFIDTINHLEALFEVEPDVIAADAHPQYLSSEYAARRHRGELPGRAGVPIVRVQHHHAHIVSCMAENGVVGEVIGLACDGVGYGDDGAVWGCEVLRAGLGEFERLGHLRYIPLIGGDAAARQTWRPAMAALYETFGASWRDYAALAGVPAEQADAAEEMLTVGANCPPGGSLGRWFDAVASLCGVAAENCFEGQAPMLLEAAIQNGIEDSYPFSVVFRGPFQIDLRPMVEAIAADLAAGAGAGAIAARFHNTVAAFLLAAARRAREETGLEVVALSGGCFANRYLAARLAGLLAAEGFTVLRHARIPCNDGGIALGQALSAAAKIFSRGRRTLYTGPGGR